MIIRSAVMGDLERIAQISNTFESHKISAESLMEQLEHPRRDERRIQLVAVEVEAGVVGFATIVRYLWQAQGLVVVWLAVDTPYQRQGIGTALHQAALSEAKKLSGNRISSYVRDDLPMSLDFALNLGFERKRHVYESALPLHEFDSTHYQEVINMVERSGIRLATLAELSDVETLRRRHYELFSRLCAGIPGEEDDPCIPFDQYCQILFDSPGYRADLQVVALDGDRLIGMATSMYRSKNNELYNYLTGVDSQYRRRGIALALKVRSLCLAQSAGVTETSTHNSSLNYPMVALNQRLGYRARPGIFALERELSAE